MIWHYPLTITCLQTGRREMRTCANIVQDDAKCDHEGEYSVYLTYAESWQKEPES